MKKFGGILVGLSLLSLPLVSMAQTTTSANVQALLEQIKTLQAQLDALKQAQTNLKSAKSAVASTTALIRNLRQGMSGDDVTALQAILATDPSIYPEGIISGYFGTLTAKALKKFQERNGLEGVGFVGPRTLKLLNGEFEKHGLRFEVGSTTARRIDDNNDSDDDHKVLCVPPGQLIAPGLQKKEGENRGKGKGGENFIQASTTNSVLPICRDLPGGIQKKIDDDWWKHLPAVTPTPTPSVTPTVTPTPTATPTPTPTVTPTPDTTAPVISAVSTLNLMGTTTSIVWSTDEASNSKIWFGTTSPITTSGVATKTDSGMVTNHVLNLSDLATSTTYFYVVGSTDSSGNIATSSQASFLTATGL